ncbi:MAG: L-lysine 6-transaminase [Pseudomonadota bacterium]
MKNSPVEPKTVHEILSRYILADGLDPVFDAERSHGAYLYDARTGREFLDLFSFFATQPIGYNHPKIANDEFRALLGRISVHRPTLSDVYTTEYASFVETFARIAGRGLFRYYFFVEGGTLGNENAIKTAFDWKVRKNLAAGRGEKGSQVIHFHEAFHGRSGYTLSLTNTFDPNKHKYFAKFDWPRITNPKLRFPVDETVLKETAETEKQAVKEIKEALRKNPHDIAALIIEPIQAEGGDNHFRPEFLRQLRQLADENDFLLIFDEVQTGMGLTGKMWCFEHFGVKPDLLSFGKKAQIAGCACTERVDEVKENVFHVPSRINSTWGGNLTDMVRCQRYLEIIEEERLVENAASVGAYFLSRLEDLARSRSKISNVRGRGLMIAFDLPDTETRNGLRGAIHKNGAIILGCGSRSLRLRPHLSFTRENVDQAIDIINKSASTI